MDRPIVEAARERAGGNKELADLMEVSESAVSRWGREVPIPRHARPRLEMYLSFGAERWEVVAPPRVREAGMPYQAWRDPQQRRQRHMTATLEVIRRLEVESDAELTKGVEGGPATQKLRIIWDALHNAWPLVAQLGGWTEDDWRKLFENKLDYWRRISRHAERDVEDLIHREGLA